VKGGAPQGLPRAAARSLLISADMAHAVHPNFADKHEPGHRPRLGAGPVIKVNANQAYASDAVGIGFVTALCRSLGIAPQHFVTRSDLACGSTIGPLAAASVGIRAVDLGSPMLSMHSCRELAGADDVAPMIALLAAFFARPLTLDAR
jgi:aspartyl aminopeptidase